MQRIAQDLWRIGPPPDGLFYTNTESHCGTLLMAKTAIQAITAVQGSQPDLERTLLVYLAQLILTNLFTHAPLGKEGSVRATT